MSFFVVMHGVSVDKERLIECTGLRQSKEESASLLRINKYSPYELKVRVKLKVNSPFWLQFICVNLGIQIIV